MGSNRYGSAAWRRHTSLLSPLGYPGVVQIHNARPFFVTYKATVIDANTGTTICKPGTTTCSVNIELEANETRAMGFQNIFETALSWTPTAVQPHAVILLTEPGATSPPAAVMSAVISNVGLGGPVDMTNICAVNPVTAVASAVSASAATIFDGTIAGSGGQTGTFTITVAASAATASAIEVADGKEKTAATFEKAQAIQNVTGTLKLSTSASTVALTGTYNSLTNAVSVTGGTFALNGSVSGTTVSGSYTSGAVTGSFSAIPATAAVKASTYCGSYNGTTGGAGVFNFTVGANGALNGVYNPTTAGDTGGTVSGSVSGTTMSGTASSGSTIAGSVSATAVSGTYLDTDGGTGSFSGSSCAIAR